MLEISCKRCRWYEAYICDNPEKKYQLVSPDDTCRLWEEADHGTEE